MDVRNCFLAVGMLTVVAAGRVAAQEATESPVVGAQVQEYRLNAGDGIVVQVFEEPDLDAKVRLSENGRATLPLIGELVLSGMGVKAAATAIEAAYRKGYLVKPAVTVTVTEKKRERFNLIGQVAKPNAYYFPDSGSLTLLDAIGLAGGFTRMANQKVVVTRASGSVVKIDASDRTEALKFRLLPGDTVDCRERGF
jgi:protein involved in polysaccharide export with SLBB domain